MNDDTQTTGDEKEHRKLRGWWRAVGLLVVVVVIALLTRVLGVGKDVQGLREWVRSTGLIAPLVYVLVRAGASVALIPGSAISAAAGVLFNVAPGIICVSAGKTLGACIAFLAGRYFARDAVERWLSGKGKRRRLDELVAEHGVLIVAAMRLLPVVPFSVQNYAFGLTSVRFGPYLFWSWLCMLPGAAFVVTAFSLIAEVRATSTVPVGLLGVVLAATMLMLFLGVFVLWRLWAVWQAFRRA